MSGRLPAQRAHRPHPHTLWRDHDVEVGRALTVMLLLVTASSVLAVPCPRGTLTGEVTHVRDGDAIVVGSVPSRLNL